MRTICGEGVATYHRRSRRWLAVAHLVLLVLLLLLLLLVLVVVVVLLVVVVAVVVVVVVVVSPPRTRCPSTSMSISQNLLHILNLPHLPSPPPRLPPPFRLARLPRPRGSCQCVLLLHQRLLVRVQ